MSTKSIVEQIKDNVRKGNISGLYVQDAGGNVVERQRVEYSRQRAAEAPAPSAPPAAKTTRQVTNDALEKQRAKAIDKINARRKEAGLPPAEMPKAEAKPVAAAKPGHDANPLLADIIADATADKAPAAMAAMEKIAEMVELMRTREQRLADAEDVVKKEKAALWTLSTVDLPELLRESGLTEVTLADGITKVSVVDEFSCGISEERRAAAGPMPGINCATRKPARRLSGFCTQRSTDSRSFTCAASRNFRPPNLTNGMFRRVSSSSSAARPGRPSRSAALRALT